MMTSFGSNESIAVKPCEIVLVGTIPTGISLTSAACLAAITILPSFELEKFREHLSNLGDSLLAVSDGEVAKVHVHTEHPGDVFQYGSQFGQLGKIKIDNMRIQHETIVSPRRPSKNPS